MYKIGDKVVVVSSPQYGCVAPGTIIEVVESIPGAFWITNTEVQLDFIEPQCGYTFHPFTSTIPAPRTVVGNPKYNREIKPGTFVDVYDVLYAFKVTDPCLQHLIKKALAVGQRGHKDHRQDLVDIRDSAQRALDSCDLWETNNA